MCFNPSFVAVALDGYYETPSRGANIVLSNYYWLSLTLLIRGGAFLTVSKCFNDIVILGMLNV